MERKDQAKEFFDSMNIWMPDYAQRSMGQFNVFRLQQSVCCNENAMSYSRKGFYKISLIKGHTKYIYADKTIEFKTNGLIFSNPLIPYSWEMFGEDHSGYFCVFTEAFIDELTQLKQYPVFKPGNDPVFELNDKQAERITSIFERMISEIESEFEYKYDALRNMISELIFAALKMQPAKKSENKETNSASRITSLFTELLERQFPIESTSQQIQLRTPADFAEHLSIHINHLNRTLKNATGKTTSQLVAARIIQEARALLKHTDWTISEIAWCLGFEDLPHFINFFKKYESLTPRNFRKGN